MIIDFKEQILYNFGNLDMSDNEILLIYDSIESRPWSVSFCENIVAFARHHHSAYRSSEA